MAKCPNCSFDLKPWHINAECPSCKVNIPNFNWEERLEEDAVRSEKAFAMLNERVRLVKAYLFGSRMRIARLILTFTPLLLLVIPFINVTVNLPFLSDKAHISVLTAVLWVVNNGIDIGSALSLLSGEVIGTPVLLLLLGTVFFLLAFLCAVISFFLLIIRSFSLGANGNIVCNVLSIIFSIGAVAVYLSAFSAIAQSGINFITDPSLGIALFVAFIFYAVNLTLSIVAEKSIRKERREFREKRKAMGKLS